MNAGSQDIGNLLDLERRYDLNLQRPRIPAGDPSELRHAAEAWSSAVWAIAADIGPAPPSADEIGRGNALARSPIFICGAHRSGTTLVRDLIDGHPALAVLPSEGTFFTNFERQLQRMPAERWLAHLGCEWLRRLANPIHQEPYWLLGRSSPAHSPYVEFARSLMAWWPIMQDELGGRVDSWPLATIAIAYAQRVGRLSTTHAAQRWAEKTPTNERFIERLRSEFPRAKIIHVIRNPYAVLASHVRALRDAGERLGRAARVLSDLNRSYRIAIAETRSAGSDHYLLLRYEELVENPSAAVARIAGFLQIDPLPILTQPTAAGVPTISNSSFPGNVRPEWAEVLTREDCDRLTAVVGNAAAQLGYAVLPLSRWRARLIRAAAPITSRLG